MMHGSECRVLMEPVVLSLSQELVIFVTCRPDLMGASAPGMIAF